MFIVEFKKNNAAHYASETNEPFTKQLNYFHIFVYNKERKSDATLMSHAISYAIILIRDVRDKNDFIK